jgi:23S rRNA (guanosine2251-2'-O)-methyltransferase
MSRLVYGKHAVLELLESGEVKLEKVVVLKNLHAADLQKVEGLAKQRQVKLERESDSWFRTHCKEGRHQGMAALAPAYKYAHLTDLLRAAPAASLLVVLDQVEDPRNLGAILRSCDALGASGVVIPRERACEVTPTVEKAASGAAARVPVAQVVNLNQALEEIKKAGFWCFGLSLDAKDLIESEAFSGKVCLVLGSEGRGLRPLVARNCDKLLKIRMRGQTESLNVSVAAGIVLHLAAEKVLAGR